MKIIIIFFLSTLLITTGLYAGQVSQKKDVPAWEVTENFVYARGDYGGDTLIQTAEFDTVIKRF